MNFINLICPPLPYFIVGGEHIYRPGDVHERRTLRNVFDLIYVYNGELHMEQAPFDISLRPGQFFIIVPSHPHKGSRICTEQTGIYWIHFYTTEKYYLSEEFIPDCVTRRASPKYYYTPQSFTLSIPRYGTIGDAERVKVEKYLQRMNLVCFNRYLQQKTFPVSTGTPFSLQKDFINFLQILYAPYCHNHEKEGIAKTIHDYLDSHYAENISLNQLARQYSYSASHLIRCFKQSYQVSPMQYLKKLRIRKASLLLVDTNLTIQEIGEQVGLRIPSYFIHQFKTETGVTPAQYRLLHSSDTQNSETPLPPSSRT